MKAKFCKAIQVEASNNMAQIPPTNIQINYKDDFE